jgi:hypothetical protein
MPREIELGAKTLQLFNEMGEGVMVLGAAALGAYVVTRIGAALIHRNSGILQTQIHEYGQSRREAVRLEEDKLRLEENKYTTLLTDRARLTESLARDGKSVQEAEQYVNSALPLPR